jgi:hypothetical protein
VDRSWEYINRSQTRDMNMEIGTEDAKFPEKDYMSGIFVAVHGRGSERSYFHALPKGGELWSMLPIVQKTVQRVR